MCGIVGIFDSRGLGSYQKALQSANDIVLYRGPDGAGFSLLNPLADNNVDVLNVDSVPDRSILKSMTLALAHRRLAIIDLSSSGLQPMGSDDSKLWIVYNGEVYNYVELRAELEKLGYSFRTKTDTEVVLNAYAEWASQCVHHFNGMWAFAIVDLRRNQIFCSRDRVGIKPFHYSFDGGRFVFSSEIKQLLEFPFISRVINQRNLYDYLRYGYVDHNEKTFFKNINNLLPGTNLIFDLNRRFLTLSSYYKLKPEIDCHISLTEAAIEFRRLLTDSVRLRLRSDVPVGSCLSGGLDSSSIVCLMNRQLKSIRQHGIQHTFSSHFNQKEANELEYIKRVTKAANVNSHFVYPNVNGLIRDLKKLVWHQEEPFGSTSIFAQWSVFELARKTGITVMLDGQGADETFAGYHSLFGYYFKELLETRQYSRFLNERWKSSRFNIRPFFKPLMLLKNMAYLPKRLKPLLPEGVLSQKFLAEYGESSSQNNPRFGMPFGVNAHLNNALYHLTFSDNLQALLKYEDRNSMAFSIEARVPFLDYRLIEFAFSLPAKFKIRGGYTKRVLRDGMAGIIPEDIRFRVSKLGFATPEQLWLNTTLQPLLDEALSDERVQKYINPANAKKYIYQQKKLNVSDFVPWRWISTYLWIKEFQLS